MANFSNLGGVGILGFISPKDTNDTYAVIDPIYGIDGLRNVDSLTDLDVIPQERRRAGMIVGVSGGTLYYKLKPSPWTYTSSDWGIFSTIDNYVTGGTNNPATYYDNHANINLSYNNNLLDNTYSLPYTDSFTTGATLVNDTILTFYRNDGSSYFIDLNALAPSGATLFDGHVTGFTYDNANNIFLGQNQNRPNFNINISILSSITVNGNVTVSNTIITNDLKSFGSISATTFYGDGSNLIGIDDFYVTGGTYSNGNLTLNRQNGSVTISGLLSADTYITGFTYLNNNFVISQNNGRPNLNIVVNNMTGLTVGVLSATTYLGLPIDPDNYVTGGTYSNGSLTLNRQNGSITVSGFLTGTTDTFVTGFTFNTGTYDLTILQNNGVAPLTQNLSIFANDVNVTGGTYNSNNGVATFYNNIGGSFQVSGFLTGFTDIYLNSGSYDVNTGDLTLTRTDNINVVITGITDYYVTGGTYSNGTLILNRQNGSVVITGLTSNALSATSLNIDYIDFNTGATVTQHQGRVSWDSGTGTLNIAVGDGNTGLIDLQVGQEEIVRVFNSEGNTLQKGEIVYVSGSQGNRPSVKRALAINDGYSVTTLGMVDLPITSGSEGYVTTFGVISNLNTTGLTGGTPIWLSPTTPGAYTSIKPQAPYHTVLIGYVVRVHPSTGSIFVNISNGWELDELHDVRISGATEGDLLIRSSYNGTPVWLNSKTLNGNYIISSGLTVSNILTSSVSATTLYGGSVIVGVDSPSLNTTVKIIANSGITTIYSIPTSAYTGAFFDYTVNNNDINLRAGNIMSLWSGNIVNYTETSTNDIGDTGPITFNMVSTNGFAYLRASATTDNWVVKTIIRSM